MAGKVKRVQLEETPRGANRGVRGGQTDWGRKGGCGPLEAEKARQRRVVVIVRGGAGTSLVSMAKWRWWGNGEGAR